MLLERFGFPVSTQREGGAGAEHDRGRTRFGFEEREQIRNRRPSRNGPALGRLKNGSLRFRRARRIKKRRFGCNGFHGARGSPENSRVATPAQQAQPGRQTEARIIEGGYSGASGSKDVDNGGEERRNGRRAGFCERALQVSAPWDR